MSAATQAFPMAVMGNSESRQVWQWDVLPSPVGHRASPLLVLPAYQHLRGSAHNHSQCTLYASDVTAPETAHATLTFNSMLLRLLMGAPLVSAQASSTGQTYTQNETKGIKSKDPNRSLDHVGRANRRSNPRETGLQPSLSSSAWCRRGAKPFTAHPSYTRLRRPHDTTTPLTARMLP